MTSTPSQRVQPRQPDLAPAFRHARWLRKILALVVFSLLSLSFAAHAQSFSWIKNR